MGLYGNLTEFVFSPLYMQEFFLARWSCANIFFLCICIFPKSPSLPSEIKIMQPIVLRLVLQSISTHVNEVVGSCRVFCNRSPHAYRGIIKIIRVSKKANLRRALLAGYFFMYEFQGALYCRRHCSALKFARIRLKVI